MRTQLREGQFVCAVLWSEACALPAQPLRYAGVWAGLGASRDGDELDGCERDQSERRPRQAAPPPLNLNGPARALSARARGASSSRPLSPSAPTGRRACPCPRPPHARALPNGRAALERPAAAARGTGPSVGLGPARPAFPASPSTRQSGLYPLLGWGSGLARAKGIYLGERASRKCGNNSWAGEPEVTLGFPGCERGAAGLWITSNDD